MSTVNGDFHPIWVFKFNSQSAKFQTFFICGIRDGLPGFPACPCHSRAWVWEWGTSASPMEDTVFVLSHEE